MVVDFLMMSANFWIVFGPMSRIFSSVMVKSVGSWILFVAFSRISRARSFLSFS